MAAVVAAVAAVSRWVLRVVGTSTSTDLINFYVYSWCSSISSVNNNRKCRKCQKWSLYEDGRIDGGGCGGSG